ncbi:uncharacterized protein LOC124287963 [Haliotis rubra]|uniref:uncharacterized protein LOC124287963 n=1 Tax=Haliotis rubra TaxID=36100 RepID=UPI001EE600A0|nr:uncharacterized protein LOC124287963 [Haliotis rubra]
MSRISYVLPGHISFLSTCQWPANNGTLTQRLISSVTSQPAINVHTIWEIPGGEFFISIPSPKGDDSADIKSHRMCPAKPLESTPGKVASGSVMADREEQTYCLHCVSTIKEKRGDEPDRDTGTLTSLGNQACKTCSMRKFKVAVINVYFACVFIGEST